MRGQGADNGALGRGAQSWILAPCGPIRSQESQCGSLEVTISMTVQMAFMMSLNLCLCLQTIQTGMGKTDTPRFLRFCLTIFASSELSFLALWSTMKALRLSLLAT